MGGSVPEAKLCHCSRDQCVEDSCVEATWNACRVEAGRIELSCLFKRMRCISLYLCGSE